MLSRVVKDIQNINSLRKISSKKKTQICDCFLKMKIFKADISFCEEILKEAFLQSDFITLKEITYT